MIIFNCKSVKIPPNQLYDSIIDNIPFASIKCTNCYHSGFQKHCYYYRTLYNSYSRSFTRIKILRLICPNCGKTHAFLLSSMIPYSKFPLDLTIDICQLASEKQIREFLDLHIEIILDTLRSMKRRFRLFWKQRLLSCDISFDIFSITNKCIAFFQRQFMQNHCGILICLNDST